MSNRMNLKKISPMAASAGHAAGSGEPAPDGRAVLVPDHCRLCSASPSNARQVQDTPGRRPHFAALLLKLVIAPSVTERHGVAA